MAGPFCPDQPILFQGCKFQCPFWQALSYSKHLHFRATTQRPIPWHAFPCTGSSRELQSGMWLWDTASIGRESFEATLFGFSRGFRKEAAVCFESLKVLENLETSPAWQGTPWLPCGQGQTPFLVATRYKLLGPPARCRLLPFLFWGFGFPPLLK